MANKTTVKNYVRGPWWLTMESGNTIRTLHKVYAYDESGVIATAYTNDDGWEFTTKRPISTRATKEPDFKKKDGFLIKNIVCGTVRYDLYIHIDNLPTDERIEWKKSTLGIGSITGGFSVGDCKFGTHRLNRQFREAANSAKKNLKQYESEHYLNGISIWPSMSLRSIEERIRAFDAISDELHRLYELALELDAKDIDELVRECE